MSGKPVERIAHQAARRRRITAVSRKLRLEIGQIRAAERRVSGEPVEAILGATPEEPVEQREMPSSEVASAPLTALVGCPLARWCLRRVMASNVVERVEVPVGKGDPVVRDRNQTWPSEQVMVCRHRFITIRDSGRTRRDQLGPAAVDHG